MNNDQLSGAVGMGMGVFLRGTPMRCPPCLTDGGCPARAVAFELFLQVGDFAGRPAQMKLPVFNHGKARGIIAPVLKAFQSLQNYRNGFFVSDAAYYSAHFY